MTIEVKQLIIKSTVTNGRSEEQRQENSSVDLERFREMLLEECRELITTTLNNIRER
jgi:hypothetical protein